MEFVMQLSEYPIVQYSVDSDKYHPALLNAIHGGDIITDNISKYLHVYDNINFLMAVGKTDNYLLKNIRQNRRATGSVLDKVPIEDFADTGSLYLKMSNFQKV
jgi:hypothetical protein